MRAYHLIGNATSIGGPARVAPDYCNALANVGVDVSLLTVARGQVNTESFRFAYREYPGTSHLQALSISPELHRALRVAAREPAIFHSHSMWVMPIIYASWAARGTQARAINSPHGALAPWAMRWRRWRKLPFWIALQHTALKRCACLHATCEAEYEDLRNLGFKNPILMLPNPVPIPPACERSDCNSARPKRLLYLGRLHPVKGVDLLLKAWRQVQGEFPNWELHLVGPNDGEQVTLESYVRDANCERVTFVGPLLGEAKMTAYRKADLFILPSHAEAFGLVVAEALAHQVPAIVCKGAPWSGLETNGCGWWIDQGENSIADALRTAMQQPTKQLREMGQRGREWVQRDFSEQRIGEFMRETYTWLLGGGQRPACVRLT